MLPTLPANPITRLNRLQKLQADLMDLQEDLFMHKMEGDFEVPAFLRAPGPGHSSNDPLVWAEALEGTIQDLRTIFPHRDLPPLLQKDFSGMVPSVCVALGEPYGENARSIFKAVFHLEHLVAEIIDVVTFQIHATRNIPAGRLSTTCDVDLASFGAEQMDLLMPRKAT